MGDLNIKLISKDEAEHLNNFDYDITLKIDGTLIYYIDGKLFSPRCERTDRFIHIAKILREANFPNCMGEMFCDIPNTNVFEVSKSENWAIAKFMPFDLLDNNDKTKPNPYDLSYSKRKIILNEAVAKLNNPFIIPTMQFKTFQEGWAYVKEHNSEGLVIRNENNWFKIKLLKEAKIPIKEHEAGKDKGTFILDDQEQNRISGTSVEFVIQYLDIKKKGKQAWAEVEYAFKTKDNKLFQPRLRRVFENE